MKREPAPELLACAFVRSVGPALLFFPPLGATKVAPAHLSPLRCDQLPVGTTELLVGFNGQLLVGQRMQGPENTPAQVRVFPSLNDGMLASSPRPAWSRS
jgi:hypothetical protein